MMSLSIIALVDYHNCIDKVSYLAQQDRHYYINFIFLYRYLIENDADLSAVNNEGEVPLDLAEEEEMEEFLSDEVDNQGSRCI